MTWRYEDGGPRRLQSVPGRLGLGPGSRLRATTRVAPGGDHGRRRLRAASPLAAHGGRGDGQFRGVDRCVDRWRCWRAHRSCPAGRSGRAASGLTTSGSIHVVFGNHAHRLDGDLRVVASRRLPRDRPYNSFVTLSDGTLVTKDFGGSRPGVHVPVEAREPCELIALDPEIPGCVGPAGAARGVDRPALGRGERRVRGGGDQPVPGALGRRGPAPRPIRGGAVSSVRRSNVWMGLRAGSRRRLVPRRRRRQRTLRGHDAGPGGVLVPLHLVRVDVRSGLVRLAEVCGLLGGLVANPPLVDVDRGLVVAYDSGNGVVACFDADTLDLCWRREQDHASHLLLYADSGELVMGDGNDVVVLDIASGSELARVDPGHGIQSVLFPCPGKGARLLRVHVHGRQPDRGRRLRAHEGHVATPSASRRYSGEWHTASTLFPSGSRTKAP